MAKAPLPPGRSGLPLIGETLSFVSNGFQFVEDRANQYGPVFRTNILGRQTAVITTPDASTVWIDPEKIFREGSMPPHIQQLFGGRSLPLLDGSDHRTRKLQILAGFTREALADYLVPLEVLVASTLDRWSKSGEIAAIPELKRLAIEGICGSVLSLEAGDLTDRLRTEYGILAQGFNALPIPVPGSRFKRAIAARDRIFSIYDDLIRNRRREPARDALSRILEARSEEGAAIADADARLELHHLVVAGYIIYAEFAALLLHLDRNPAVLERLRKEVSGAAPSGPIRYTALAKMPYLLQVIQETKRLCPILPAVFGRAKRDFEFKGFMIPAGWMVLWGWRTIHLDRGIYRAPERFDPERFSPERAEDLKHEHAFTPQGAGPATGHRCPGIDYSTMFMQLFGAHLVRDFDFLLPAQRLEYAWKNTPPEPKDGLLVRFAKRG